MQLLCVDIGNSSVKAGIIKEKTILNTWNFSSRDISSFISGILQILNDNRNIMDGISFCSVAPKLTQEFFNITNNQNKKVFQLTHQTCKGLNVLQKQPETIGHDRLAGALAADMLYQKPVIILDTGTAITLDVVTNKGYACSMIAPGLGIITDYLHEKTALLPKIDIKEVITESTCIGLNTNSAIKMGCTIGFSGMLDALLKTLTQEIKTQSNDEITIVATGGNSEFLPKTWLERTIMNPTLNLLGLSEAFHRAHT